MIICFASSTHSTIMIFPFCRSHTDGNQAKIRGDSPQVSRSIPHDGKSDGLGQWAAVEVVSDL